MNCEAFASPAAVPYVFKLGGELNNDKLKFKLLASVRTWVIENQATYKPCSALVGGYQVEVDAKRQALTKYNFGVNWEPATNAFVGLRHESVNKEALSLGKFFLLFHHNATKSQTVGTEFALDWQKKIVAARFGFLHRFNEDTSSKIKLTDNGDMNVLLKHKLPETTTVAATTGFNLKSMVVNSKTKALPIGLQFDVKL